MGNTRCAACRRRFEPRAQSPQQRFCSAAACQAERRRRWQRDKRRRDPDYRENQAHAQARWARSHPDYWRQYRAEHPEYVAANRAQQSERDRRRRQNTQLAGVHDDACGLAKSDAWHPDSVVLSGTYHLIPVTRRHSVLAKSDAYTVRILPLADT